MTKPEKTGREWLRGRRQSPSEKKKSLVKLSHLDQKDRDILFALSRFGGTASAERISEIFPEMAARTVRYRMARMRDKGIIQRLFTQTHEYKFGLGDSLVLFELGNKRAEIPFSLFQELPCIYYLSSTYGRYNGYLAHINYPRNHLGLVKDIILAFKEHELITDAFLFDTVDYVSLYAESNQFDIADEWTWDWENWINQAEELRAKNDIDIGLDFSPGFEAFDTVDIQILKMLERDAGHTLKSLGDAIGLSEGVVGKKIRHMEDIGIVKGYRWILSEIEDTIFVYCFVKVNQKQFSALSYFITLPFPREIMTQSRSEFYIRIKMNLSDLPGLLTGLDTLRHHVTSLFIQFAHNLRWVHDPIKRKYTIYDTYNPESGIWEIPIASQIQRMKSILRKKKK